MNISCLPDEIQLIIINYLPMHKLISDNIPILFHEYIMNYINTKLITNMYNIGYIYKFSIYQNIIDNKLEELALNITKKYMELIDSIGGPINLNNIVQKGHINNSTISIIRLNLLLTYTTVGKYYNSSTEDKIFRLSSFNNFYDNIIHFYYYREVSVEYNEQSIKKTIICIFLQLMDYSDTTVDIKSMEIVKTSYSDKYLNNEIKTLMIKYI